jgi:hypothetical protein
MKVCDLPRNSTSPTPDSNPTTKTNQNATPHLPEEILFSFFILLGPKESLSSLTLVCKKWKQIADDDLLWKHFLRQVLGFEPSENQTDLKNYYRQNYYICNLCKDKGQLLTWSQPNANQAAIAVSPNQKSIVWRDKTNDFLYLEENEDLFLKSNSTSPKLIGTLPENASIRFSKNGEKIIGSHGQIWDAVGNLIVDLQFQQMDKACFSPTGNKYFASTSQNAFKICKTGKSEEVIMTPDPDDREAPVFSVLEGPVFSNDEEKILLSENTNLYVFDIKSQKNIHDWFLSGFSVAYSIAGNRVGVICQSARTRCLRVYELDEKNTNLRADLPPYAGSMEIEFIADNLLMITGRGPTFRGAYKSQLWQIFSDKLELIKEYAGELIANGRILKQIENDLVILKSYISHNQYLKS